jgi:pyruvate/2-oxoglutarate dehydrogenase complex dihydrolipoamide dehydrogenase (E3) component
MFHHENIILGCGPAALQCAYYFEKYKIPYIILEKNNDCASFFYNYPLSGKLISINKKNTGNDDKEYNLRHDWNSLLTDDDFRFTEYSDEYYPKREELHKYLNDYAKRFGLKIRFNTNISRIDKTDNGYKLIEKNSNNVYTCIKLIISTGLSKMIIPDIEIDVKDKIKHYGEYPRDYFLKMDTLNEFKNKRVLIIGGGNASYELANIINEVSSSIVIHGRRQKNWSMSSHYTGDIRSIYLPYIDTFILKSLNAIDYNLELKIKIYQTEDSNKYHFEYYNSMGRWINCYDNIAFDKVIFCTGWRFDNSIFGFDVDIIPSNNYPNIKLNYESINNTNLYFIGTFMHSLDFKKSAGGFISGFRFLIKNFVCINYNIEFDFVIFNLKTLDGIDALVNNIVNRLNTSPELYQMFGTLADIIYYNKESEESMYYKNMPLELIQSKHEIMPNNIIIFIIKLDYGNIVTDIIQIGKKKSNPGLESRSVLIHPIIEVTNKSNSPIDIMHLDEDLFVNFSNKEKYYDRIFKLIKSHL